MVRLLPLRTRSFKCCRGGFNPTMVRLLPALFRQWRQRRNKVSIPQWCDCCCFRIQVLSSNLRSFNPTMVRLLHERGAVRIWAEKRFQSHNGAIAARSVTCAYLPAVMVSIPQWCDCCHLFLIVKQPQWRVSIPQWCDCCKAAGLVWAYRCHVSIPQWCDCCKSRRRHKPAAARVSIPQWCDCCSLCKPSTHRKV